MKKYFASVVAVLLAVSTYSNASVLSVDQSAFSGDTVINFDNLAAGTSLDNQYVAEGVADFNAWILGAQGYATTFDGIPAFSGTNMVFIGASIQFVAPVARVGAWIYKHNGQQYLTALDASMNVLLTVAENTNSTDDTNYNFVGIASSAADIAYVVISNKDLSVDQNWNVGGATTFFDDLTFGDIQAVPEPATVTLFGLGALGLLAGRRKAAGMKA